MHAQTEFPSDLPQLLHKLEGLSISERSAFALRYAALCLEYAAYENAEKNAPDEVAALIQLAAKLETLARGWSSPLN